MSLLVALQNLLKDANLIVDQLRLAEEPPVVPPVEPPVVPPFISKEVGKYRADQPYLFQTTPSAVEPSRVPGGAPLRREGLGPTAAVVGGNAAGWRNRGGDWLDANGVSQGTAPWFSTPLNKVSGNTAFADYTVDCTKLLEAVQEKKTYLAIRLQTTGGAVRVISGKLSSNPPFINVTYEDGTVAKLACRITAAVSYGRTPETTAAAYSLPVFTEFNLPTAKVIKAELNFRITQHWSGSTNLTGFLIDPPKCERLVIPGIASAYTLDENLTERPDVIFVHSYKDGTKQEDYFFSAPLSGAGYNFSAEKAYDPAIYGTGPTDLTKFPHVGLGKWVGAPLDTAEKSIYGIRNSALWSLVSSTHNDYGFEPLAPGIGAVKMLMRKGADVSTGAPVKDGSFVGYGGTNGGTASLFLPEARFGRQKRIFVRQYIRIGSPDGKPYRPTVADRFEVYKDKPPATAVWSNLAGKCFAAPTHNTTFGGFSGTAGGYYGNNFRAGWHDNDFTEGGPDEGGWGVGIHLAADYLNAQPPGYNYGNLPTEDQTLGQKGLGGIMYANKWYCLEVEVDQNSVSDTYPGFKPDGVYRIWLDGILCYEMKNAVFRQNPPYSGWRTMLHRSLLSQNQTVSLKAYGADKGLGYIGVTARHSGLLNGTNYTAFISRKEPGKVIAVLVKRTDSRLGVELAKAEIDWADGDVLTLKAIGSAPTKLSVLRNTETVLSYDDKSDAALAMNMRVGVFGTSNGHTDLFDIADGWCATEWTATDVAQNIKDNFQYTDGGLNVSPNPWISVDSVGIGWVTANRLWFPRSGNSLTFNRMQGARPIREIGHRDILFNWFHGGLTQNTMDRVIYMTGLVVADNYIGPMKLNT